MVGGIQISSVTRLTVKHGPEFADQRRRAEEADWKYYICSV